MTRRNSLIALGAASFLLFVVTTVPARLLANLVPEDLVQMNDLSGTLWRGNAQTVEVAGVQLRDANWELHPLSLLLGRLALTLDAKWNTGYVRGDVAAGVTGSIRLRDVEIAGPLAPVLRQLNLSGTGGELAVDLTALDLEDRWPTRVNGSLRVGRLPLSMLGIQGAALASYALDFDIDDVADDGAIPGVLTDGGGPMEVIGELRLTPPGSYAIQARIKARPNAPPELVNGLMLAGPKQADGSHDFQMTGSL
ncbi:MAG: type II secretion system protein N [Gammaproteobacteria bacterium]